MSEEHSLNSVNLENLKNKHDEAWENYEKFIYEVYEPRFYKHKVGRKQQPINGWIDIQERIRAEDKLHLLSEVWLKLYQMIWQVTGDHRHIEILYEKKETTDGPRYVRKV